MNSCQQIATLLREKRAMLMANWRDEVSKLPSARDLDQETLTDHIPNLLDEIALALFQETDVTKSDSFVKKSPPAHGLQRLQNGFAVEDVVVEYNILRLCIHDLAEKNSITLQGTPFRIFNTIVDNAIAIAVRTFAVQQTVEIRSRREDYLAFIAHDLRTPLNAASLIAMILEKTLSSKAELAAVQANIKTLQRNIGYISKLVDKILDENVNIETETGIKIECRELDLWPLIEALIYDLHPVVGAGRATVINSVAEEMTVYADAALLRRVFQNLIANALAHTPNGRIIVSATILESGAVECKVSDNGEGIAEDRLASIFEKFETGRPNEGGLGLGLTICKTFVEAHQGSITAVSKLGTGTCFSFTLPPKK